MRKKPASLAAPHPSRHKTGTDDESLGCAEKCDSRRIGFFLAVKPGRPFFWSDGGV